MIVHEVDQGSEQWHAVRAGACTASMFRVARSKVGMLTEQQQSYVTAIMCGASEASAMVQAGYKAKPRSDTIERALAGFKIGDFSDPAKNYAFKLAIERLSGEPLQDDKFETYAMRRGHELEPDARRAHEKFGVVVRRAGFVTTDDGRFGSSTDGFIDPDDAAEYKCLVGAESLREVLLGDLSAFTDQVQGGLWVTGRRRFHFGVYCPALKVIGQEFTLHIVERDDDYIEALERDLLEFDALVNDYEDQLRRGAAANADYITQALAA